MEMTLTCWPLYQVHDTELQNATTWQLLSAFKVDSDFKTSPRMDKEGY